MQYGKKIETSIGDSLKLAGVKFEKNLWLDVNSKIDFLLESMGRRRMKGSIGLQVSLKPDKVKMKVSKLMALNRCRFFIYILVRDPKIFEIPSRETGKALRQLIKNMLPDLSKGQAMLLEVGNTVTVAYL